MAAAGLLSPLQWEIGGWTVIRDMAWGLASAEAPLDSPGRRLYGVSNVDVAFVVSWFVVDVVCSSGSCCGISIVLRVTVVER